MFSQTIGFVSVASNPPLALSSIAAPTDLGFPLAEKTPPTGQETPTIYGLGSPSVDAKGGHSVFAWNLDIQNIPDYGLVYHGSPGWLQLDGQDRAAGTQLAMFTEPGPTNPQTLWLLDGWGGIWQYQNGHFVQPPGVNVLQQNNWTVFGLTDHFALAIGVTQVGVVGEVFQWNEQTWVPYMTIATPNNTTIKQIAFSEPIQTNGFGTFGPSQLWGLDTAGHIFYAAPALPPPR